MPGRPSVFFILFLAKLAVRQASRQAKTFRKKKQKKKRRANVSRDTRSTSGRHKKRQAKLKETRKVKKPGKAKLL
jgi:hypothetical protein